MKRFSDFGIDTMSDRNIFQVPITSITDIINCEIEVLDYEAGIKTQHGENRYIVKILHEGLECKFFTNAVPIKEALDRIPKSDFPFATVIKQQKFGSGNNKTYYFT
ncbi:MAG: hypothetical protein LBV72_10160 [Tannerella sp.]|jgi:hypothetical protein|nr:hypothetical protein [Tannerella sp.]